MAKCQTFRVIFYNKSNWVIIKKTWIYFVEIIISQLTSPIELQNRPAQSLGCDMHYGNSSFISWNVRQVAFVLNMILLSSTSSFRLKWFEIKKNKIIYRTICFSFFSQSFETVHEMFCNKFSCFSVNEFIKATCIIHHIAYQNNSCQLPFCHFQSRGF